MPMSTYARITLGLAFQFSPPNTNDGKYKIYDKDVRPEKFIHHLRLEEYPFTLDGVTVKKFVELDDNGYLEIEIGNVTTLEK